MPKTWVWGGCLPGRVMRLHEPSIYDVNANSICNANGRHTIRSRLCKKSRKRLTRTWYHPPCAWYMNESRESFTFLELVNKGGQKESRCNFCGKNRLQNPHKVVIFGAYDVYIVIWNLFEHFWQKFSLSPLKVGSLLWICYREVPKDPIMAQNDDFWRKMKEKL